MLKNHRKKDIVIIVALFIAGLSILLYPWISNSIYQYKADKEMKEYENLAYGKAGENQHKEELKCAEKYNHSLLKEKVPDSFSEREGIHDDKEYEALLNPCGNGIMGIITIPSISVKLPIYHYTAKETLLEGAGHLFGSSLPVGGESSHTVLAAHRGLPSAKMFTDLDKLQKNDVFYLDVLNRKMAYSIDLIKTVEPEDTSSLNIEEGKDFVTLITCTPYGRNTHRLLVRGHRVPYVEKEQPQYDLMPWKHILFAILGFLTAVLVLLGIYIIRRLRETIDE